MQAILAYKKKVFILLQSMCLCISLHIFFTKKKYVKICTNTYLLSRYVCTHTYIHEKKIDTTIRGLRILRLNANLYVKQKPVTDNKIVEINMAYDDHNSIKASH